MPHPYDRETMIEMYLYRTYVWYMEYVYHSNIVCIIIQHYAEKAFSANSFARFWTRPLMEMMLWARDSQRAEDKEGGQNRKCVN